MTTTVTDKRKKIPIYFENLEKGDTFYYEEVLYMKTATGIHYLGLELSTGRLTEITGSGKIDLVDIHITATTPK